MALSRIKSWGTEVLSSSDLNAEFNNIINNALSLISPLTGNLDFGGFRAIGLSKGSEASPGIQFTGDTDLGIRSSGDNILEFVTAGADRWQIDASGHLLAVDDNTYDIGAAGATRPRHYFGSGDGTFGGNLDITGSGTFAGAIINNNVAASTALYNDASQNIAGLALTNGQLVVGSTGAIPVAAAIASADGSVTVTNGAGSIDLSVAVGGTLVANGSDQTLTQSSTTLQNVTFATFTGETNTSYEVIVVLLLNAANATSDWKFGWTVPAAATGFWGVEASEDGNTLEAWSSRGVATTTTLLLTIGSTLSVASVAGDHGVAIRAVIRIAGTGGTVQFQAAQNTSNASDNKILKDSILIHRVIQ